jgi:membrane fusion protein (multidrug efflux system)
MDSIFATRRAPYAAIAAAFTLTLAACGGDAQKSPGMGPGGMPPAEVDVISVTRSSTSLTQDLPGRLQAVRTAQVRARVEGIVEKRLFSEGSDVKQGATLFLIDDRNYKATELSARVDVAVMKNALARYQPLLPSKAVSQQEYDQAQVKLMQTEAALTRAQIDLENTKVPAPISGRIGRAEVTEGALVGKGDATLLATIEQIDPIYANFTQTNSEVLRLQKAMKAGKLKRAEQGRVEMVLEDGSIYPLPGKLMFSDLAVDPNTGTISLRAEFPNPKRELLPGTFVKIRFVQGEAENTIRLPQRAVQSGEQGQFVMVVGPEDKVVPMPIETSGMSGGDWIVSGGLKGDEKVIVNGIQKVRPGAVVKPVPWNPQAGAAPAAAPAPAAAATPASPAVAQPKK